METFNVVDFIGTNRAISHSDGEKLFSVLSKMDLSKYQIIFDDLSTATTAFLNASIGKLIVTTGIKANNFNYSVTSQRIRSKILRVMANAENYEYSDGVIDVTLENI